MREAEVSRRRIPVSSDQLAIPFGLDERGSQQAERANALKPSAVDSGGESALNGSAQTPATQKRTLRIAPIHGGTLKVRLSHYHNSPPLERPWLGRRGRAPPRILARNDGDTRRSSHQARREAAWAGDYRSRKVRRQFMTDQHADASMLTTKEVARRLRVTPPTVQQYIRAGQLRASKVGRAYLVSQADLGDFVRRHQA